MFGMTGLIPKQLMMKAAMTLVIRMRIVIMTRMKMKKQREKLLGWSMSREITGLHSGVVVSRGLDAFPTLCSWLLLRVQRKRQISLERF